MQPDAIGHGWRRFSAVSAVLLAAMSTLTACSDDTNTATWVVGSDERVTSTTTGFTAIVNRIGCSSGVQGKPEPPKIEYADSEVRVTFRISPRIDSGTCEGTPGVTYEVDLAEPLGNRSLVDGECHRGSPAWNTEHCLDEGVRHTAETP